MLGDLYETVEIIDQGYRKAPALVEVLTLIHKEYTDPFLSLETASGMVGLSARHVTRLLKGHCGMTFTGYVRLLRIEKAKHLLLTSEASIKIVAGMSGYCDISWFTRYFQTATGFTPAQFRKQQRSARENVRFRLVPMSESA